MRLELRCELTMSNCHKLSDLHGTAEPSNQCTVFIYRNTVRTTAGSDPGPEPSNVSLKSTASAERVIEFKGQPCTAER